ncbi:MAG: squalene synthase HpnC [Gammaproteobacteria bacterium]|nr:MAG: squalene synthase HpnC [Gammaproteobacteria bacterium]
MTPELTAAYESCMAVARSHYENFPVASWLVQKHLRIHVATIYTFARRADDLADEGTDSPEQKIAALKQMGDLLNNAVQGKPDDDFLYIALANTIDEYQLDPQLFHDLLDAFTQDVSKARYENFDKVLDYCRRSANPVGRLMLQLFGEATEENNRDSDLICSALQLINFMQDIQQDLTENDRIYFPQDEMQAAGITDQDFRDRNTAPHVVAFVRQQTQRAQQMMLDGASLGNRLKGRFGLEIRTIIQGGLAICNALFAQGDDIYSRPRLTLTNKLSMLFKAFVKV